MAFFCLTRETVNHEEIYYDNVIIPIRIPAIDQLPHPGQVFSLSTKSSTRSQHQPPEETKKELRRYDKSMLKRHRQTARIMSGVLPMFGITKGTSVYNEILNAIVGMVSNLGNSKGTSAFSVCITKQNTRIHREIHCRQRCLMRDYPLLRLREMALIRIALRESEAERMRQMMVPASESAIKNLLKRVRVEEEKESTRKTSCNSSEVGESGYCTVCLEPVESYATEMPCKHAFHEDCIVGGLKVNHKCPVCRSEVPTE